MAMCGQDQAHFIELKLVETMRQLSGSANNFVGEELLLNAMRGSCNMPQDSLKLLLASMVKAARAECFIPLATNLCGCGSDCCGGGCCGCGRYYRVKIG